MNSNGRPEGLNHVHITVPIDKLEEARVFYLEVIGLTKTPKPEELTVYPGFWVQLDGLQLHVGGEDTLVNRWESGAHLSIEVADIDDLNARRARLEGAGIAIREMVYYPGYERFEFRDPFGNRMELITRADVVRQVRKAAR
jgi:catechol 2,3-dioxygenase-like lactoylglutathione lyase family enzyme